MKQVRLAAGLVSLLALVPTASAAVLSLYEFGNSSDSTDTSNYISTDTDANSTAGPFFLGSGYGSATTNWPNVTSQAVYNATALDWRLYRKSFPTYFETTGSDGDFLNDYQRAWAAGTNYLEWTLTPSTGYQLDLSSFTMDVVLSNSTFKFYYYLSSTISNDNYATVIDSVGGVTASGSLSVSLAAPQFQSVKQAVTFRLWTWSGASGGSSGSAWQLDTMTTNGAATLIPEPASASLAALAGAGFLVRRRRA